MRFDASRAMEQARAFAPRRIPGTDDDRKAIEDVSRAFQAVGYQVERTQVVGRLWARPIRVALTWLTFGVLFPLGLVRPVAGVPLAGIGLMFAGVSGLVVVPRLWRALVKTRGGRRTETLVARRPATTDPPVRVVFLTALDSPPTPIPGRVRRHAAAALRVATAVVVVLTLTRGRVSTLVPAYVFDAVVVAFELSLLIWLIGRWHAAYRPPNSGNGDGLATLIEMARTWPKRTDERIESRFVAAGGQTLDLAGMTGLVQAIRNDWPEKPTLVIGIWSPGLGPPFDLTVLGQPPWSFLRDAAAELWVPFRNVDTDVIFRDVWPFGASYPEFVGLFGAEKREVDPASLALAAQVATETALRWGKLAGAGNQVSGASNARSSQKPG